MSNKKKIFGLLFVIMFTLSCFTLVNVYAKNTDTDVTVKGSGKNKEACEKQTEVQILNKYKITLSKNSTDDYYTITVGKDTKDGNGKYPKFYITRVNGTATDAYKDKAIYYGNAFKKIRRPDANKDFEVTVRTEEDELCDEVVITYGIESNPKGGETEASDSDFEEIGGVVDAGEGIDCGTDKSKYVDQNDFKSKYCYALLVGKKKDVEGSDSSLKVKGTQSLKCSAFVTTKEEAQKIEGLTPNDLKDGYYNVNFFYAQHTYKKAATRLYTYHRYYVPDGKDGYKLHEDKEEISCNVKCTESVKVLYMPPVSSKAGFCFEYKVRVESYVNCKIDPESLPKKPKDEKDKYKSCTPTPYCNWSSGTHKGSQGTGGPTEDYEKCVNECDGGKYTSKCSKKCFKEVYGVNRSNNTTPMFTANSDLFYYWYNGSIYWHGAKRPGYYYWTRSGRWGGPSSGYHSANGSYVACGDDGFYRHDYGGGSCCDDTCWWGDCSKNSYLNTHSGEANEGQIKKDIKHNESEYKALINDCKAKASCTTSSAEFTISVDYTPTGQSQKVTVDFPYESKKSTLHSGTSESSRTTCEKKNDKLDSANIFNREKLKSCNYLTTATTNLIDYGGCYVGKDARNYYMGEWSVPGTWVRNKTGEIAWSKPADTTGISFEKYKFCIPLDAKDVNQKWWIYELIKRAGGIERFSTSDLFKQYCMIETVTKEEIKKLVDENKINYNIHAATSNFGFFKWDITIDCFYALNKDLSDDIKTVEGETKISCTTGPQYQTRSVDLETLFPNSNGTEVSKDANVANVGDEPGFNWQVDAKLPVEAFGNMATRPDELIGKIQQRGNKVYEDDKAIDYEFELTPTTLNAIKGLGKNYIDYQGTYSCYVKDGNTFKITNNCVDQNAIVASIYRSDLVKTYAKKKVSDTALSCNNVANDGSRENCEIVGE